MYAHTLMSPLRNENPVRSGASGGTDADNCA